jgi:predicted DNA-binding antitoxin AbrB/MazE fold protein
MPSPFVVEAVYENGVFRPSQPVTLPEHERVRLVVQTGMSRARRTQGIVPWTGDAALLQRFAEDPELDPAEEP